MGRAW